MEETKLSDLNSNSHPKPEVAKWFWQSDLDPWKEQDSTKWNWKAYSYESCCIIEEALLFNQLIADLQDYEIDLKKMLQVKKSDRSKIRRIKRETARELGSRLNSELVPKSPIAEKDQKTINAAFGDVQHFLNYIMHRTPEALELYQRLSSLSLSCYEITYKDVLEKVITSIVKGAELREKVIKARIAASVAWLPQKRTFIFEAQCIVRKIQSKRRTLKSFLTFILKIYTMESFICYWLNELLRSEDWEEINILTPYLVCLVYTFQLPDYIIKYSILKKVKDFLKLSNKQEKLILYRGTALTQEQLDYYDPYKNRYFSWNGITSTSRSKKQAMQFIQASSKKTAVLFIIETDFSSEKDCEGMIDVSSNSAFPHEEEVILAPGTVFELIDIKKEGINNKIWEIKLEIKRKFTGRQKVLGTLLKHSEDKVVINQLTQEEIIKALELLRGNQAVKELEVRNCFLNAHLLRLIQDTISTTNIKKDNINLKKNEIRLDDLMHLPLEIWDTVFKNNTVFMEKKGERWRIGKETTCLEQLSLDFEVDSKRPKEGKIDCLKNFLQGNKALRILSLNFTNQFTANVLDSLKDALSVLNSLNHLSLNFQKCDKITDDGLNTLTDGLKALNSLNHLSLDFQECDKITDSGLNTLTGGLKVLNSLNHLSLDFAKCYQITDNGLNRLKDALTVLNSLNHLSLNFQKCVKITGNGLNALTDALRVLGSLKYLSLKFQECNKITNKGLNSLKDALIVLNSLNHLYLNFTNCKDITDNHLNSLKDALTELNSLNHLSLIFQYCHQITDNGLNSVKDALRVLGSLNHLSLDFGYCKEITNNASNPLIDTIRELNSLGHLFLNFRGCKKVTGRGFYSLEDLHRGIKSSEGYSYGRFQIV